MSCKCQECGKQFKVDLIISDKLWKEIKPVNKPTGGGLLCGSCIMKRIEMLNEHESYHLSIEELLK